MPWYQVTVLQFIPDAVHADWDSQCDEIFHGPGLLHEPEKGVYVQCYQKTVAEYADKHKHDLFDEYGGI